MTPGQLFLFILAATGGLALGALILGPVGLMMLAAYRHMTTPRERPTLTKTERRENARRDRDASIDSTSVPKVTND